MKLYKVAHLTGLSVYAYLTVQKFFGALKSGDLQLPLVIGEWFGVLLFAFLSVMLLLRPKRWGLGLGILLLVIIAIQTDFWFVGVSRMQKQYPGYDGNPGQFIVEELLNFAGAAACIALRWIFPNGKPATPGVELPSDVPPPAREPQSQ